MGFPCGGAFGGFLMVVCLWVFWIAVVVVKVFCFELVGYRIVVEKMWRKKHHFGEVCMDSQPPFHAATSASFCQTEVENAFRMCTFPVGVCNWHRLPKCECLLVFGLPLKQTIICIMANSCSNVQSIQRDPQCTLHPCGPPRMEELAVS